MPHSVGAFLKGVGIADVKLDSNNHLLVYLDNGKILDAGQVPASDDALDATSERPVQNKIITAELDRIVNILLADAVSNITTLQQTKVDKISGKGLSTKDFTSAHEAKLNSLHNYDDTTLRAELAALSNRLTALVGGNANEAINSFNEIIAFLKGVEDSDSLNGILAGIGTRIAAAEARITAVEVKQREIEGAIADYDAQIESLDGRVEAQYNEINLVKGNQQTASVQISALQRRMNVAEADIDSLEIKTATNAGSITSFDNRLSKAEALTRKVEDGSVVVDNTLSEVMADSDKPVSGAAVAKELAERDTTIAGLQSSVAGKADNAEFRKESIRLQSQIDSIKPIEIVGDVTNAPDEEDITTDANNLLKLKDRPFGKGLGYKILRADKTFAEQVTDPNTIYEVRYDFDLGGADVQLTEDQRLYFNGGSLHNGSVLGEVVVTGVFDSTTNKVFGIGYNYTKKVVASQIGMIRDDESARLLNTDILRKAIEKCEEIVFDGKYYIYGDIDITNNIKMQGGCLALTLNGFSVKEGVSVECDNITFESKYHIFTMSDVDYLVDKLAITKCTFAGCSLLRAFCKDILFASSPYGIQTLIVESCIFRDVPEAAIRCHDIVISDVCRISNNIVEGFNGSVAYFGETNTFASAGANMDYWADVNFEYNSIYGEYQSELVNTSYYTSLLVDGCNRVFYSNNIVKDIITSQEGGVAYDVYGSCRELYMNNNTIENIASLSANSASSIFYGKLLGKVRYASGNVWRIDFSKCREIAESNGKTFTDEEFAVMSQIGLLNYSSVIDEVTFVNNTVEIKGGGLKFSTAGANIKNLRFNNNKISAQSTNEGGGIGNLSSSSQKYTFCGNEILLDDGRYFSFVGHLYSADSTEREAFVLIKDNIFNFPIQARLGGANIEMSNNTYLYKSAKAIPSNAYINSSPNRSVIDTRYCFVGEKYVRTSGSIDNTDCTIRIEYPESVLGTEKFAVYINTSLDVQVWFNGTLFEWRVEKNDETWTLKDKYNNIIKEFAKYESATLYYMSSFGGLSIYVNATEFIIYIQQFEKDNRTWIRLVDSKYNICGLPVANKYNAGMQKWDSTLKKWLTWTGTSWVDATGTAV